MPVSNTKPITSGNSDSCKKGKTKGPSIFGQMFALH